MVQLTQVDGLPVSIDPGEIITIQQLEECGELKKRVRIYYGQNESLLVINTHSDVHASIALAYRRELNDLNNSTQTALQVCKDLASIKGKIPKCIGSEMIESARYEAIKVVESLKC